MKFKKGIVVRRKGKKHRDETYEVILCDEEYACLCPVDVIINEDGLEIDHTCTHFDKAEIYSSEESIKKSKFKFLAASISDFKHMVGEELEADAGCAEVCCCNPEGMKLPF